MPVIAAIGRLGQDDGEFKASLDCIARPCLRKKKIRGSRKEGKEERKKRKSYKHCRYYFRSIIHTYQCSKFTN
jgi:hypothetical protein